MASVNDHVHWRQLALVTIAMVGARTFAMAVNRIVDRHIDARNPRTQSRELVTGVVSLRTAWAGAIVALVVLMVAAGALNRTCFFLAPVARDRAGRLPLREAIHMGAARSARPRTDDRSDRRVARGDRSLVMDSGRARARSRLLDRRVRHHLRTSGLPDRSRDRREVVAPLGSGRRWPSHSRASAHYATVLLLLWFGVLAHLGWTWTAGWSRPLRWRSRMSNIW